MTLLIQFCESCNSFGGHFPAENKCKFEHSINGYLRIPFLDFFSKIAYRFLMR